MKMKIVLVFIGLALAAHVHAQEPFGSVSDSLHRARGQHIIYWTPDTTIWEDSTIIVTTQHDRDSIAMVREAERRPNDSLRILQMQQELEHAQREIAIAKAMRDTALEKTWSYRPRLIRNIIDSRKADFLAHYGCPWKNPSGD